MKSIRLFLSIISFLSFITCEQSVKNDIKWKEIINVNLDAAHSETSITNLFSEIDIIKLETNDESIIGNVIKLLVTKDLILIADRKSVSIFDRSGTFLNKLNSLGKGPGQYPGITDILFDEKKGTIEILSAYNQNVYIFNKDLKYIEEYKVDRYAINSAIYKNNIRLFHCGNDSEGNFKNRKLLEFKQGNYKNGFLSINKYRYRYLHYIRSDYFSYFKDEIIITSAHCDTIYSYKDEKLTPKYLIDIGRRKIPLDLYEKPYNDISEFTLNVISNSNHAYGVFNFLESEKLIFFKYEERQSDGNNKPFGTVNPIFTIYNKENQKSIVFNNIIDDKNFPNKPSLNKYTTFFSQPNGLVAYFIPSFEFIDMCDHDNDFYSSIKKYDSDFQQSHEILERTKKGDNPIIFIAKLK